MAWEGLRRDSCLEMGVRSLKQQPGSRHPAERPWAPILRAEEAHRLPLPWGTPTPPWALAPPDAASGNRASDAVLSIQIRDTFEVGSPREKKIKSKNQSKLAIAPGGLELLLFSPTSTFRGVPNDASLTP